jgi:hypothetical protein
MIHQKQVKREWREENLAPFNELMISWNAPRPNVGNYLFYVSVKTDDWSPWLLYASWGSEGQRGFVSKTALAPVEIYQDALSILNSQTARGFQIKVISEDHLVLPPIFQLHVYTNSDQIEGIEQTINYSRSVRLPFKGLSQMALSHVRHKDLCSPSSTTAVVRYLLNDNTIDPLFFARDIWDSGFDIYGNWVFNVAQASVHLGPIWSCWVERLNGFDSIYRSLHEGIPVVVSIRGPLEGSAQPYSKGHLLAIIGYESEQKKVICMDPAFASDEETFVSYDFLDFMQAWQRRGKIAYVFSRSKGKDRIG